MAPCPRLWREGAMQGNPCYARLFADLTRTPQGGFSCPFGTIHLVSPNPIIASGGQSRAPPVAGGARRKPSEQGSARKAPRADAARPLRTALRPPNPRGFFDKLKPAEHTAGLCGLPRFAALVLHIGHQVGKGVYRRLLVRAFGPQQGLLALG